MRRARGGGAPADRILAGGHPRSRAAAKSVIFRCTTSCSRVSAACHGVGFMISPEMNIVDGMLMKVTLAFLKRSSLWTPTRRTWSSTDAESSGRRSASRSNPRRRASRLRTLKAPAPAFQSGEITVHEEGEASFDDGFGNVRIPYGDRRPRAPRTEMVRASGSHGQSRRSVTQVVQDGGEHLFGLVCGLAGRGAFPAPDRLQQVPADSQHDRVVEDVGGGSPIPFLAQLPDKLPSGRAAEQGLQPHQGQGVRTVENAVRVAEHRVSGKLSFERLYCSPSGWTALYSSHSSASVRVTSYPAMSELQANRRPPPDAQRLPPVDF